MSSVAIKADSLSKTFYSEGEEIQAVRDVTFQVESEKLVTITGPSGCGTSTLLKMLGGILNPSSGTISYFGEEFDQGVPKSKLSDLGYVFQSHNLLPWRTVEKNLRLPLEVMGKLDKKGEWKDRIYELLDMVGLADHGETYPPELSGGMRQRVGVIRALVHDPYVAIMDDPFGALDAITRQLIHRELLSLWEETKKTILMVTTDYEEAIYLSSKVLIMSSAPGTISKKFSIDLPYMKSEPDLKKEEGYKELRARLKRSIEKEKEYD